jgi:hypothetical protein
MGGFSAMNAVMYAGKSGKMLSPPTLRNGDKKTQNTYVNIPKNIAPKTAKRCTRRQWPKKDSGDRNIPNLFRGAIFLINSSVTT